MRAARVFKRPARSREIARALQQPRVSLSNADKIGKGVKPPNTNVPFLRHGANLPVATLSTSCLCLLDYASGMKWSLQPGMLRLEFFTKEIRRPLRGGAQS